MAKTVSLICAAAPRGPAHYLARLRHVTPAWSGADWDAGKLGRLVVDVEPVKPGYRKLYPWRIHTVVRFRGMASPKRDWTPVHALAEAVLEDVGGVMIASRVVLARLPSGVRASLCSTIEEALDARPPRFLDALTAAVKWKDPLTDEALAARLEETIRRRGDTAPLETLVQLACRDHASDVYRWLGARVGDATRLVHMLERTDEAGLPLGSLARERLRAARTARWRVWAHETPPSRGDVAEVVSLALTGDPRARVVLAVWCQHHVEEGPERVNLASALMRASAARGSWPEAVREAVRQLIWKSEDDPLPGRGGALHEDDARWVAGELAARNAERRRYDELVAGIDARNKARLRDL